MKKSDIDIISIPPCYTRYIEEMHTTFRGDFFAIKNFKALDSITMEKIDSFVKRYYDKSFDSFGNFTIDFYIYSKNGVNEKLIHDPTSDNSISLYGNDLILSYEWHNGACIGTNYYKNGDLIKGYEHRIK